MEKSLQVRTKRETSIRPEPNRLDEAARVRDGVSEVFCGLGQSAGEIAVPIRTLCIEGDGVDVIRLDSGDVEAVFDGMSREAADVLDACKALLLNGRDESAVVEQGRR